MNTVDINTIKIGGGNALVFIGGPCVIESEEQTLSLARELKRITDSVSIPFVFKASFDKANRSSADSFRGPGMEKGLEILAKVKNDLGCPVLTDIHTTEQVGPVAQVVDVVQIPAFLCRQTDLVLAAAQQAKTLVIKKGQFLAPWDVENIIKKAEKGGARNIIIIERGTSFGYNQLVSDMRSLPIMRSFGYPVVFDVTHSVQMPGGKGTSSGGDRSMIPYLSRAAVGAGCDGIFLEVHRDPDRALSDGPNSLAIAEVETLLRQLKAIHELVKQYS